MSSWKLAFTSTSNGVLTGVTVPAAGKKTYTYATAYPMATYNVCFSTTVYNTWTATYTYPGGTMPMPFMIYPTSDTPTRRTAWEQSAAMMAALRPVFGEYPFVNEKYGIYQFEFGGGMEHQTNSGQGGGSAWNESLTAHELDAYVETSKLVDQDDSVGVTRIRETVLRKFEGLRLVETQTFELKPIDV